MRLLTIRYVVHNAVRFGFTMIAIAFAVMTYVLVRTAIRSWSNSPQLAAPDRILTRHAIGVGGTMPVRYVEKIRTIPHVKAVTYEVLFATKGAPPLEKETFFQVAVDPSSALDVFPEMVLTEDVRSRWLTQRNAALVGSLTADRLHWTVGNRVRMTSGSYPEQSSWEFDIVGTFTSSAPSGDASWVLLNWHYVNESAAPDNKDSLQFIITRVDDSQYTTRVAGEIDAMFAGSETPTFSQEERAFKAWIVGRMSALTGALNLISLGVLVIMALLVGNAIAMAVRERTRQYAITRAIGFTSGHVLSAVIAEAMLMGLGGAAIGVLSSYLLIDFVLANAFANTLSLRLLPNFHFEGAVGVSAMLAAAVATFGAAILPARRVARAPLVDALRHVA